LLKGQHTDGLFAESPGVADLGGLEEVSRHFPQAIRCHTSADVVNRDHRIPALTPKKDSDPFPGSIAFGVFIRRIRYKLVQGVLGVLIGLPADKNGFGEIPYA
jgi:hypothetical protein